ncbi:MAG: FadR family transcriptional regulator [Caldilineaceae bacterium]|nr:FadR family transcriptional regulator [Caldilineaceae bacterium]
MNDQTGLFQPLERHSTLASRVTRQLETMIMENRLQPGDRLPSERDLAMEFGVSRTVVREAVRALVAKNLLEVLPGSGTLVRRPSMESVARSMALLLRVGQAHVDYEKVHEVRRTLEVEIAGLAAERRTESDLEMIERLLAESPNTWDNQEDFALHDLAFHNALAQAAHNEIFLFVLNSLADIMLEVRRMAFTVPGLPQRAQLFHHTIVECIRDGDPQRAQQAMHEDLLYAENNLRQALALLEGDS